MNVPTMFSICHRHSHCHRRRSFFLASSWTCHFSPHPPLPSFTFHQQWPRHPRASPSGTPATAYPARRTVAVAPTRCVGQLFITTDSVKIAVVWIMAARVEGQPVPHSPRSGERDNQRATGFRRLRAPREDNRQAVTAPAPRRLSRRTGADAMQTKRWMQVSHRAIPRQTTDQTDQTGQTTCHHRISSLIRSQKIKLSFLQSQFTNQPSALTKCVYRWVLRQPPKPTLVSRS